ncbi:MBL fold metallo-hydrolase [Siminovitchia sediminis]|uniref:MBL fold metallo-hydrolase n=1 Tax=Siminovitchia sediminis TaxID=1274353 RepID=A0ABW4KDT2_9BACI
MPEVFPILVPVPSSLKSMNFYLIQSDTSLILIDAVHNHTQCWNALNDMLHNNDLAFNDITHIVLTHHHADHVGLVNKIVKKHPIPVYAHPLSIPRIKREPEFMQMRIEFFENLYEEMGCGERGKWQVQKLKEAVISNHSQRIEGHLHPLTPGILDHLEVIHIPGHAPDQIALYDRSQQLLFSGDLLIHHISSNALVEPDQDGKRIRSLSLHLESLKKCLELPVAILYPGHGPRITNHRELISKRITGKKRKAEDFLSLINAGYSTASGIAKAYYKDRYEKQFSLVMSEVIGHLDYLEEEGRVKKNLINGIWRYNHL